MKNFILSNERGSGLAESLISVAIAAIAITALVASLSTGSMAIQKSDERITAENLARSQMEDIKGQTYSSSGAYSTITAPDGYTISIATSAIDSRDIGDIQKVTVTVTYGTDSFILETYKANR
jgi:Tfp pilus assembly protein PilV